MNLRERKIHSEAEIKATRSSGKGGQHVNKVSTKVEIRLHIAGSTLLSPEEKAKLQEKLAGKLTQEGWLILTEQESRSQLENKQKAIERMYQLLEKSLRPVKKRKASKPTRASKETRLKTKKLRSEIKKSRRSGY